MGIQQVIADIDYSLLQQGQTLIHNGTDYAPSFKLPDYKGGYTLWTAGLYDGLIYEIDLNTNQVINTYQLPSTFGAQFISLNPAQTELWIPCWNASGSGGGGGLIVVFDLRTKSITHTINCGINPMCATFTPNGKKVYVSNLGNYDYSTNISTNYSIQVISTATYSIINTITSGIVQAPLNSAVSLDGRYLYVGSYTVASNTYPINIIDTSTDLIYKNITLPSGSYSPQTFKATIDGRYMIAECYSGQTIWLNTQTFNIDYSLTHVSATYEDIISPDGRYCLIQDQSGSGYISVIDIINQINLGSSTQTNLTGLAGGVFSPDGTKIYQACFGNNGASQSQILIIDATTFNQFKPYNSGGVNLTPQIIGTIYTNNHSSGIVNCVIPYNSYIVEQANMQSVETQFNRQYIQNLTAQTTTSTSPVSIGSVPIIPLGTNPILISAIVRGSNNTVGDGITVSLYSGTTSGALTNLLDSETYTQEGVASNEHTFNLYYEATQTQGTTTYYSIAINSITGGTASAKLVKLAVAEYPDKP